MPLVSVTMYRHLDCVCNSHGNTHTHTHGHGHHLPPSTTWRDIWLAALSCRSVRMHLRWSTGWFLSMSDFMCWYVPVCRLMSDIKADGGAGRAVVACGSGRGSTWGWWSCGACWSCCSCRRWLVATRWEGRPLRPVSWISCRYGLTPTHFRNTCLCHGYVLKCVCLHFILLFAKVKCRL